MTIDELPVVVIGAGPIGLAAASHLYGRGMPAVVLEAGDEVAASVREWGHVRLFSPWASNTDAASRRILTDNGWVAPHPDERPTGRELVEHYLQPLADSPQLAGKIRTDHRVVAVARAGVDKVETVDRAGHPFAVVVDTPRGRERMLARAVLDASGTWATPNPIGADGLPARGERENAERISYGIPDVLGALRERFAGRRVVVIGSGHSAQNVVRDLTDLRATDPATEITWLVRREDMSRVFGRGQDDVLPARGELGAAALQLVRDGRVGLLTGFRTRAISSARDALVLESEDGRQFGPVDEVIATTGFRPDLALLRELRLSFDPITESPDKLAPLIDPNVHSCASVPPHGAAALAHPEPGVYLVGTKSYGRAPTFLLATGYEQVRSVVAELDGDRVAAGAVALVLPEFTVRDTRRAGAGSGDSCGAVGRAHPAQRQRAAGRCGGTPPQPAAPTTWVSSRCCG